MSNVKSIIQEMRGKMQKSLEIVQKEMSSIRTGSASTTLVENIQVEQYGTMMPLNQLAHLSTPEGRCILIQPWDPTSISAIEKAIQKSQLNLTPNNDGKCLRIIIPPLSEERRLEIVKLVKKMVEDGKVAIRNERRGGNDGLKKLQKDKMITEDELKTSENTTQKITDEFIEHLNKILAAKEKEILTV